jgi:hypothetical protein
VAEDSPDPTIVDRWLQDQQQWQRTLLSYFDSMVKNEEFLVHLGNAMRGSLLAGKPYPGAAPATPTAAASGVDEKLDQMFFALRQLQGQVQDLLMAFEEIRGRGAPAEQPAAAAPPAATPAPRQSRPASSRKTARGRSRR